MKIVKPAGLLILAAAVFWLIWNFVGCDDSSAPQPVEKTGYLYIGLVAPQSGPLEHLGRSLIRGAEMAVEAANAGRTASRRPVKLLIEDEAALAKIPDKKRLANDPRVAIVAGHMMEKTLEQSANLYLSSGRPVLLPVISSDDAVALGRGWFYPMMPLDSEQAAALGRYAAESSKPDTF